MITPADDFPIHQLARPIADVGTERIFTTDIFLMATLQKKIFFLELLCAFIQV